MDLTELEKSWAKGQNEPESEQSSQTTSEVELFVCT